MDKNLLSLWGKLTERERKAVVFALRRKGSAQKASLAVRPWWGGGRVGGRKRPVLRGAGLEGPSCLLDVPPKQNNPGRSDLVPLPERKGPAEAGRGLSWKEIKMKMLPVTCKSRPF